MSLVCFDTQLMIWGIKEQATSGQEAMINRTKRFIAQCDGKGIKILVPSIVVGELLIRIPADLHGMVLNLFQRSFIVAPFDLHAAAHFAKMWQDKADKNSLKEVLVAEVPKRQIKADFMIVATAIASNADCIYTHDKDVRNFAKGYIEVRDLPEISEQLDLL